MQHEQAWSLALHHVFLSDCKRDNIRKSQFDTWLVQDFLFVREFTRLAATLLSVAPYSDFNVLLGGLVALKSELNWFEVRYCWGAKPLIDSKSSLITSICLERVCQ